MFTGIIEGLGTISEIKKSGAGCRISVDADFPLEGLKIGDSIAVNGACLTVIRFDRRRFYADVSPETLSKTTFGRSIIGDRVNLERALRLSDRIDGHLVSGHIDGAGVLSHRTQADNAIIIAFSVPDSLTAYMIPKGSVAVDGVSLTINTCWRDGFDVSIIPHTAKITTIGMKRIGESVNIETDMIGKYVKRLMSGNPADHQHGVSMKLLEKSGFL